MCLSINRKTHHNYFLKCVGAEFAFLEFSFEGANSLLKITVIKHKFINSFYFKTGAEGDGRNSLDIQALPCYYSQQ